MNHVIMADMISLITSSTTDPRVLGIQIKYIHFPSEMEIVVTVIIW